MPASAQRCFSSSLHDAVSACWGEHAKHQPCLMFANDVPPVQACITGRGISRRGTHAPPRVSAASRGRAPARRWRGSPRGRPAPACCAQAHRSARKRKRHEASCCAGRDALQIHEYEVVRHTARRRALVRLHRDGAVGHHLPGNSKAREDLCMSAAQSGSSSATSTRIGCASASSPGSSGGGVAAAARHASAGAQSAERESLPREETDASDRDVAAAAEASP